VHHSHFYKYLLESFKFELDFLALLAVWLQFLALGARTHWIFDRVWAYPRRTDVEALGG
jgi:hypothetical protein